MKTIILLAVIASALNWHLDVQAEVRVLLADGLPATEVEAEVTFNPVAGGWDIVLKDLYNPGGETEYFVHGSGETINSLFIDVPCWANSAGDCVPAGSPVFVSVLSDDAAGIRSVNRIEQTGTAETTVLMVDVRENVGTVIAEDISRILAGGDVFGPIIATTENNSVRGVFWVEAQGDILGDVRAENGRIGLVYAHGTVGKPWAQVEIRARHMFIQLQGDQAVYADVDTMTNGGQGGMWLVHTPIFEGRLNTWEIFTNQWAGVPALVSITDRFAGVMTFGNSFVEPGARIEIAAGGLQGQIVFNGAGSNSGVWTSPVIIGPEDENEMVELSDPAYQTPAAMLGGGAVGLAPFQLHDESCYPPNGEVAEPGPNAFVARLRHYGPVRLLAGDPVTLERRPEGSTGPFTPLSGLDYGFEVDPQDPNTLLVGPNAAGEGGFEPGYEYRIRATSSLVSDVDTQPAVIWTGPLQFTLVASMCSGDIDGDRVIGVGDFLFILASWGPANSVTAPLDTNGDGMIGIVDFLFLLANWGPC